MLRPQFLKYSLFAAAAMLAMACGQANADLVVSGDFADGSRFSNGNALTFSSLDNGWEVKNFTFGAGGTVAGDFTSQQATVGSNYGRAIASAKTIGSEDGTKLSLKFDWTAAAAATGDSLSITYQVLAFNESSTPSASGKFFNVINFRNYNAGNLGGVGTWANLVDGTTGTTEIATGFGTHTGTAGVLTPADITLDLGALGLGNIKDYKYVAVKFNAGVDSTNTTPGGILDNVSLTVSTIPEPSSLAMLGLCGTGLFFRRKRA